MSKITAETKEAVAKVCADIRHVLAVHPCRSGWIVRPYHTHKDGPCIQLGHQAPELQDEVDTLLTTVNLLELAPPGYVFRKA